MSEAPKLVFRRVIVLESRGEGVNVGWLEDNFHHFGVTVRHVAGHVTDVAARIVRYPWTTCAEAGLPLRAFIGTPLPQRAVDLAKQWPMQHHCTHVFELAALVLAQAASMRPHRDYDARVWQDGAGSLTGVLIQNSETKERWTVRSGSILRPPALAGQSLVTGFRERLGGLEDEYAERSWILRRAFWLAEGDMSFVKKQVAAEVGLGPVCYTYQPQQSCRAFATSRSRIDINASGLSLAGMRDETP